MSKKKILYITQEIFPYVDESPIANISRHLPQAIQEKGNEIRTFMPNYGTINERRNQLHEVIRLSGLNLIIDDTDHSLVIKVASIQPARMQVYFIDNDDFFQSRQTLVDENGEEYDDNDERSIFFIRGVMETIKKLRWVPDIIHCHGAFSALAALYTKIGYMDDPLYKNSKVVYSAYNDRFEKPFSETFADKLRFEGITDSVIEELRSRGRMNYENLIKTTIDYCDGVIQGEENIESFITDYVKDKNKPFVKFNENFEEYADEIDAFYKEVDA